MYFIKRFFFLLFIFIMSSGIYSQSRSQEGVLFRHKIKTGSRYKIEGTSNIKFFKSNVLAKTSVVEYEAQLRAKEKKPEGMLLSYFYQSKDKNSGKLISKGEGSVLRSMYSDILAHNQGAFFPKSIGVPAFVNKKISIGRMWEAPVREIIDFRNIGIETPFVIKAVARYRYLGVKVIDGKKYDIINVFYIANVNTGARITGAPSGDARFFPARLTGYYERTFYWDNREGFWIKMDSSVNLILTFTNALSVEWEISGGANQHKL
jgi:hypothetical protein